MVVYLLGLAGDSDAGNLEIDTKNLIIQDGAFVSTTTLSKGRGGNLFVRASEKVDLSGSSLVTIALDSGNAGDLTINTGKLVIRDGAIASTSTLGSGDGGEITVNASDSVELLTTPTGAIIPTGLLTNTLNNTAKAGNIRIDTKKLTVQEGALLSTQSGAFTGIGIVLTGGQGGDIFVSATDSVEVTGSSSNDQFKSTLSTSTFTTSPAGNLSIATGKLLIQDRAEVTVNSLGLGNTGNLEIEADSIEIDQNGTLNATTISGQGGNVVLQAENLLILRNDSQISTTANGIGNGGNVDIDTNFLVALENSNITANAFQGQGGNIRIKAQGLFLSSNGNITASSQLGIDDGVVTIKTPDIDPSNGIVELPESIIDIQDSAEQSCQGSNSLAAGQLIITGRGGLPPKPDEIVGDSTVLVDLGKPSNNLSEQNQNNPLNSQHSSNIDTQSPELIREAQGWIIDNKGKVVLTAQADTVTPYEPFLNPADCQAIKD